MKKTILICDRCGKSAQKLFDLYIPYNHGIYGVVSHQFELCNDCIAEYINDCVCFYNDEMKKEVGIK